MPDISNRFKSLGIREKKKSLKIGVISGGISSEREISLITGKNIYQSLVKSGYNTVLIDLKDDFYPELKKIDIAFMAVHGRYGEDGTVQGLLELMEIPYTGSGILASAIAINKIISKKILIQEDIPTPEYMELDFTGDERSHTMISLIEKKINYPMVIKPNSEGSTIGVNIVQEKGQLRDALREAAGYDSRILVEEYIKGRELTVSIIGREPVALPIIEIKPKSGFYDYKSKYTKNMTQYIVPAELDRKIAAMISEIALKCHRVLGCSGISRVDFMLDDHSNAYVFELNTMPGMTATSLVPKAAKAAGIDFALLVEIILDSASLKI
jgi:D-alanine-D-alanine ligase